MAVALAAWGAPAHAFDPFHGEWRLLPMDVPPPTAPFPGRTSFALVHDTGRDRLVLFGGDPGPANDVWVFPLDSGSAWVQLAPAGSVPAARYGAAAVYDPVGDRMIVFGGYSGAYTGFWMNDVWQLSFSGTPTWTQLVPGGAPPSPRQDPAAVYDPVGRRMVIFGGYGATGPSFRNDTWTLSLSGPPAWSQLNPGGPPPSGRNVATFAYDSARRRMLLFGGWDGSNYLGDTWALDLGGGGWAAIPTATSPPGRREGFGAYDAAGDRMVIFGGSSPQLRADTWQLSLGGTPDWSELMPTGPGPTPRANGRAVMDAARGRMIVVGGFDGNYRIDARALAMSGPPQWSVLVSPQSPAAITPRRNYAAVFDPHRREAIVFGGEGQTAWLDETWHLPVDDASPQWQLAEVGNRPTARQGHRAVWDPVRRRMIVVGGYDGNYLNDVWEYARSPVSFWKQLVPTGGTPAPRMLFGLGYDPPRDRLIMIGGHFGAAQEFMNDVWALPLSGPQALSWSPLVVGGSPPSPRWIYGMQYDTPRDRFVFFGGVTAAGRPNEVWSLQLGGSPAWIRLFPSGAPPSGRSDHAMVFDALNDRMVVFGGFDDTGFRNDVWALLQGGTPQWARLTPTGGPPSGRDIMAGIYDPVGARMVIYGGWNGSYLNDTWTLTWAPPPVPIQASLVDLHVEPGLARMSWFVPHAASVDARVERREGARDWQRLGAPERTALDRVTFEDRTVTAGTRYSYRLWLREGSEEGFSAAVDVDIPPGFALALAGAEPNPAHSELRVGFTLPRRLEARLELLDIGGRRLASRDLSALGAGRHRVQLGDGVRLEPGLYLIRLVTPERALTRKALVIR